MTVHELALCAGCGGFSLALTLAGVEHRTVCFVERDSYAASIIVARMAEKTLDQAPVWSDIATFDGRPWRGRVDLITAGFPCQPWSIAGPWTGVDDPRWLWPHVARITADVGPRYVFLENTIGLNPRRAVGGLPFVLQDLARLGFDAEWGVLTAAAVGATHRRPRLWILAARRDEESSDRLADADDKRRQGVGAQEGDLHAVRPSSPWPPRDDDEEGWRTWPGPQPTIRRSVDGDAVVLADPLHLGGNGLVPRVAAEALAALATRAGWGKLR
jgi:DNA (cytosine-5)-methyltransferase 1